MQTQTQCCILSYRSVVIQGNTAADEHTDCNNDGKMAFWCEILLSGSTKGTPRIRS